MSRLLPAALAVSMLAACHAEDGSAVDLNRNSAAEANAATPAEGGDLAARAEAALGRVLVGPSQTSGLRATPTGAICGTVAFRLAEGGDSGPRPFLVSPDGQAIVSSAPRVMVEDPADSFVDAYMRWCASVEELRAMQAQLSNTSAAAIPALPPGPVGGLPDPLLQEEPAPVPAAPAQPPARWGEAAPSPAGNQQAGDRDSFSNAVMRPPRR